MASGFGRLTEAALPSFANKVFSFLIASHRGGVVMRTFAQKGWQSRSDKTRRPAVAQSAAISPIQQLHRRVGNEGLLRMAQAHASKARKDSAARDAARIQPKLTINTPGDAHELEADRVAEQVMRMPEPGHSSQRLDATGGQTSRPPAQIMRMQANDSGGAVAPPIVHDVLRSPGRPLDQATRAFMEPRFGQDFSVVHVHTDAQAAEAASTINARAFTSGRDIVFGTGEFAPASASGRRLLSHELAHVIQQSDTFLSRSQSDSVVRRQHVQSKNRAANSEQAWKERIAAWVTGGAEVAHEVYEFFAAYGADHPLLLGLANTEVDLASVAADAAVDTNPETLGWLELGTMWLFELGANPTYFGPTARTTKELRAQEGVQQVRELALAELKKVTLSPKEKTWKYGQQAFYDGLKQGNLATSFLGSYHTKAFLKAGPGGSVIVEFEVDNVTSWESGTRLRKAAKKDGPHLGIIPNRSRGGAGLHLGGNMTQYWKWSETLKK